MAPAVNAILFLGMFAMSVALASLLFSARSRRK